MRYAWGLLASSAILLTGCTVSNIADQSQAAPGPLAQNNTPFKGVVHGGQNPILGASVYLFAVNSSASGYGQSATSLLKNTSNTQSGAYGYYVTTDGRGAFSIGSGDYSCTSGQQVYLYSAGGDPRVGGGANSASGLMAVLGQCGSGNSFTGLPSTILMNEVTTVAAAYALAGFATDATHIASSNTALAVAGVKNAAQTAGNLATLTGTALTTTAAGNGVVPQLEINTLADVLAACINTTGPTSSGCTTLFSNAESGGTTGTTPTDTATAAINIAHNPSASPTALYGLVTAQAPFQSYLASAPNDWTIAITYSSNSLNGSTTLAIDGSDNIWVTNSDTSTISKFSPVGVVLDGGSGFTGGGLNGPNGIAIDSTSTYVWVANEKPGYGTMGATGSISKFNSSGNPQSGSPYKVGGVDDPNSVAIDASGNVWVSDYQANHLTELNSSGVAVTGSPFSGGGLSGNDGIAFEPSNGDIWVANADAATGTTISRFQSSGAAYGASPYSGGGLNGPIVPAIDHSGNVWVANYGSLAAAPSQGGVSEFDSSGNAISPSGGYVGGGVHGTYGGPYGIAIDGDGKVWVANYGPAEASNKGSVSAFDSSGNALSPSNGYQPGLSKADSLAIDGSGNVWVVDNGGSSITQNFGGALTELVGSAAPVVTPIVVAVKNNTLGTRP